MDSVAFMACITLFVGVTMETCKAHLIRYNLLWSAFLLIILRVSMWLFVTVAKAMYKGQVYSI